MSEVSGVALGALLVSSFNTVVLTLWLLNSTNTTPPELLIYAAGAGFVALVGLVAGMGLSRVLVDADAAGVDT